jgi:hypothetical protein
MLSKMVLELGAQEAPTASTLKIFLAAQCVGLFKIGLIINQIPRTPKRSSESFSEMVGCQSVLQVFRKPDVKTSVSFGLKYVDIKHFLINSGSARERSSAERSELLRAGG